MLLFFCAEKNKSEDNCMCVCVCVFVFLSKRKLWHARVASVQTAGISCDLVGAEVVVIGCGLRLQTLIVQVLQNEGKKNSKFLFKKNSSRKPSFFLHHRPR